MLTHFKKFLGNSWFKINSLTGFSIVVKIGTGVLTSKIVATTIGPSGMAILGNFRNFITSLETLSTGGFQNGIIKYVAENKDNKHEQNIFLSTVIIPVSVLTIIVAITLFSISKSIGDWLFNEVVSFKYVLQITAILVPFYVATSFFLWILNGLQKGNAVIYFNIASNIVGLFITFLMLKFFGISGALLATIVTQSILFFWLLYLVNQEISVFRTLNFKNFDFKIIKNLSAFTIMTLVSAVFVPVVFLSIRKITIAKLGLQQAGFWTTIDIFSGYYFLFIATLLSVFYFPRLAVAQSGNQTKKLFYQYFKTTIPIFGIGLILIYFLRTFIIKLLFDESFLPVANLFFYQLIGDFFKAISLVLAYNLIAKKHTFWYIVFEITSVSTMYFLSLYFLEIYKIQGILMAHCLTYLLYCGALFFYNRKSLA